MVLGIAYKENKILTMFIYFILLAASITGIVFISIYVNKLFLKIILIIIISLLIILFIYLPYYLYINAKTPETAVLYNSLDETITINTYNNNKYIVNISDISVVTIHNIGTKLLLSDRIEEGKLYFYLNDGTKIKTPELDKVYKTYEKLDEIVFVDRKNEAVIKEQLCDKLDGWGAKKEYPTIVSVLVALFIPFFGTWFVLNQKEFKKIKNGKATGLMAVALVISALWAIAIIIALVLL